MKIKKSQRWHKVEYGNKEFKFWSSRVRGFGDEILAEESSLKEWRKVIVLKPTGKPQTAFSIGFEDVWGNAKLSKTLIRVEKGLFGMRMGPEDCTFFIASQGTVGLEFVEYTNINDKAKSELPLY